MGVTVSNDTRLYQTEMDEVDRDDHHRVIGARSVNVLHFKKWYEKVSLSITYFYFFNAFAA